MKKLKITIDARMITHSGIGIYLKNLLKNIVVDERFDCFLIGDKAQLIREIGEERGYKVIQTDVPIYSIKEQLTLPRIIPSCDVFWSPHYNIPLLPIKAKKRLVTVHDVYHLAYFDTLSIAQKIYAKLLFGALNTRSDQVITVSAFSKNELLRFTNLNADKIKVIYNALPLADGSTTNAHEPEVDINFSYLLCVGNVKPHKNLQCAIEAFSLLKKRQIIADLKLVIVGKKSGFITEGLPQLQELLADLGDSIIFTDYISDQQLRQYYSHATCLLFPSLYEGFGYPVLEAMQWGIPIIASDRASIPEVGGDAVLYANAMSSEDFAQKISQVIDKKWIVNTEKYQCQLRKFDWEQWIEKHKNLILSL
jgi:glycosyltransferase involved in cell wall biosynthesis